LTSGYGGLQDFISDRENSNSAYQFVMPSLAVNSSGDIVIGFSCARDTEYIGASFWGRKANGTISVRPALIQAGRGIFPRERWADYSSTMVMKERAISGRFRNMRSLYGISSIVMVYGLIALLLNKEVSYEL
jgi:hypothetical protein